MKASAPQPVSPISPFVMSAIARLIQHGQYLVLDIQADGFLHHMVRNIMGCLLEIGQGMYAADHIDNDFRREDRKAAGVTAPADGLYFIHADYPAQFELPGITLRSALAEYAGIVFKFFRIFPP